MYCVSMYICLHNLMLVPCPNSKLASPKTEGFRLVLFLRDFTLWYVITVPGVRFLAFDWLNWLFYMYFLYWLLRLFLYYLWIETTK